MKRVISLFLLVLCLLTLFTAGCEKEPSDDEYWTPFVKVEGQIT